MWLQTQFATAACFFICTFFCLSHAQQNRGSNSRCPRSCECAEKSIRCHDASSLAELNLDELDDKTRIEELEIALRDDPRNQDERVDVPPAFGRFPYLSRLIIRNAGLTNIPRNIATKLLNVRTLDLAGNKIRLMEELNLDAMPQIESLQLSNNQIEILTVSLGRLGQLHYLGLDNNKIQKLDLRALANLPLLLQVMLRGNRQLDEIADDAFVGSVRIEKLDLTGGGLKALPRAIDELKSLQQLNLDSNQLSALTTADLRRLENLPALLEATVANNPIVCDAQISNWVRRIKTNDAEHDLYCKRIEENSRREKQPNYARDQCPVCDSPSSLKGRSLDTLSVDELAGVEVDGNRGVDGFKSDQSDPFREKNMCPCESNSGLKEKRRSKRRRLSNTSGGNNKNYEEQEFRPKTVSAIIVDRPNDVERVQQKDLLCARMPGVRCSDEVNSCYLFSNNGSATNSWAQARFGCQTFGFDLAVIDNEKEQKAVLGLLNELIAQDPSRSSPSRGWWIGARRSGPAGPFLAVDTGEHIKYTNWASQQPNNFAGEEDCVEMWDTGEWNDIRCEATLNEFFICEQKKP